MVQWCQKTPHLFFNEGMRATVKQRWDHYSFHFIKPAFTNETYTDYLRMCRLVKIIIIFY